MRWKTFTSFCSKNIQEMVYQISSESLGFYWRYYKKHFGLLFFWTQCTRQSAAHTVERTTYSVSEWLFHAGDVRKHVIQRRHIRDERLLIRLRNIYIYTQHLEHHYHHHHHPCHSMPSAACRLTPVHNFYWKCSTIKIFHQQEYTATATELVNCWNQSKTVTCPRSKYSITDMTQ